jgi:DNA anti-recombination protein RmuC
LEVKKARQHLENFEHRFGEVGTALAKAQNAFNTASTHLTRYQSAVVRLTGLEGSAEALPDLAPPALAGSRPSVSLE